ncbi:MAG: hypothetical protein R3E32_08965 [Chitinophagales bacterium]
MNRNKLTQFINHSLLGYGVELSNLLSYPFMEKQLPDKKFVLFSSGRAGSTLLVKLLDSHSQIQCEGEILRRKMLYPAAYINRCSQISKNPVFGFKLLSYQLKNVQTSIKEKEIFLQDLVDNKFQIIYLERKNILRQALSVMYAYHRDQWHVKKGQNINATKMTIDPVVLKNWMDGIEELKVYEKKMLELLPHLHIIYEQDLNTPEQQAATTEIVTSFLDIPHEEVNTNLKRVTPKNLSSFVENTDEIIDYLDASRYRQYLELLTHSFKPSN